MFVHSEVAEFRKKHKIEVLGNYSPDPYMRFQDITTFPQQLLTNLLKLGVHGPRPDHMPIDALYRLIGSILCTCVDSYQYFNLGVAFAFRGYSS